MRRQSHSTNAGMPILVKTGLLLLLIASLTTGAFVWLVPVDLAQNWALESAPDDPLARFEAVGRREAVWWSLRVAAPLVALAAVWGLARWRRLTRFGRALLVDLQNATSGWRRSPDTGPGTWSRRVYAGISSLTLRLLIAGWLLLAASHLVEAVGQRLDDWPVYRLRSGEDVLPNISQSNREVIRYVQATTPPDAKILVLSDQKLFFLSYYLRPRRLFHPMHPDSEFVIPLAHGERPLPAYRLDDLSPDYLRQLDPDYILEYYESPAYADPERFDDDANWLSFQRARHGPAYRPDFLVVLHEVRGGPPR